MKLAGSLVELAAMMVIPTVPKLSPAGAVVTIWLGVALEMFATTLPNRT